MGVEDWSLLLRPASTRLLSALLAGRRSLGELAKDAGVTKPTLLPILRRLTDAGWVTREEVRLPSGRETFYSLAGGSLHLELRPQTGVAIAWANDGAMDETFPLATQVGDRAARDEVLVALRLMRKQLKKEFERRTFAIILFGSTARGEMTWKSDIDMLFLYDHDDPALVAETLLDAAAGVQEALTHSLRVHPMTRADFLDGRSTIAKEAAKEGIVLFAEREDPIWQKMERHRTISI